MRMTLLARIFLVVGGCILLSSCGTAPAVRVKDTTRTFTTVVVDAGHGGKNNGAFRRYGGAGKNAAPDLGTRLAPKPAASKLPAVLTSPPRRFISPHKR